jgi:hypothetical protein
VQPGKVGLGDLTGPLAQDDHREDLVGGDSVLSTVPTSLPWSITLIRSDRSKRRGCRG